MQLKTLLRIWKLCRNWKFFLKSEPSDLRALWSLETWSRRIWRTEIENEPGSICFKLTWKSLRTQERARRMSSPILSFRCRSVVNCANILQVEFAAKLLLPKNYKYKTVRTQKLYKTLSCLMLCENVLLPNKLQKQNVSTLKLFVKSCWNWLL